MVSALSYGCENSFACGTSARNTSCGRSVCQCPVILAYSTTPRKITATPVAIAHAGTLFFPPAIDMWSAPSDGHDVTQRMQPVHSTEPIVTSLSTARPEGHALAHFAQSMHSDTSRLIFSGLSFESSPNSAP